MKSPSSSFSLVTSSAVIAAVLAGSAAFAACGGGSSASNDNGASDDGGTSGNTNPTCVAPTALPLADESIVTAGDAGVLSPPGPVFAPSFANYVTWQSYDFSVAEDAGPHLAGGMKVWINKLPEHGSTQFPIGTIIIKRIDAIPQTFAMEKEGPDSNGPVNAGGATNWRYFELVVGCDGKTVDTIWRGFGPPIAESYGGDPAACNDCHDLYHANDFIASPPLQLGNF